MSEPGFEVASAFVSVMPETSDFAAALDEQVGGLALSVVVMPNTTDFAAAFDEAVSGLALSVPVMADASDFEASLLDQAGGITVPVTVTAEAAGAANLGDLVNEQAGTIALPVTPVPEAADFGPMLEEMAGGLSVPVEVYPDTSADDFQGQLDERIGTPVVGVDLQASVANMAEHITDSLVGSIPVPVVPDVGLFEDKLDEELAGLTASVKVTPDASDFAAALDEQVGAQEITVPVSADASGAVSSLESLDGAEQQASAGASDLTARYEALQEQFAAMEGDLDYLTSRFGALSGGIASASDASSSAAGVLESLNSQFAAVGGEVDSLGTELASLGASGASDQIGLVSSMLAELQGNLTAADDAVTAFRDGMSASMTVAATDTQEAASEASGLAGQYAALQEQFAAMGSELDYVTGRFTALGPAIAAPASETDAVSAGLESLNSAFAAVGGEIASFEGEMSAAGASAAGNAEQIGLLSSMLSELQGNLTAADDAISGWVASSAAARDAAGGTAGAVDMVAQSAAGLSDAVPPAEEAASGFGGVLGELAGRLSYFAVDPFMWMYAAPLVISGVSAAIKSLSGDSMELVNELSSMDHASGLNAAGYTQLSQQLTVTSQNLAASKQSFDDNYASVSRFGQSMTGASGTVSALNQASSQAAQTAANLDQNLGTLEGTFGLTAQQAGELAGAAGVSATQLQGSGTAAEQAMGKIDAYANSNINATGAVNQMATEMSIFGDDALTASDRVTALDNAYGTLVGNFVSAQQQQLQVANDFLSIAANATQAGASMTGTNAQSIILQESFFQTAGAIEQTANAMVKQGDSTQQVTGYISAQIDKLSGLAGGSAAAQTAVQGLKQWEDNLATSTDGVYGAINRAANELATNFSKQLTDAGLNAQTAKTDVDNLTTSIQNNGSQSTATKNDRAQLIADLEAAGVKASTAKTDVDNFITSIGKIPKTVTLSIIENATGTVSITQTAASAANQQAMASLLSPTGHASGGLITGGSRRPRADDIPALLSHGEYVVSAGAVSKYGTGFLDSVNAQHFAGGGYAGDLAGLAAWTGSQYTGLVDGLAAALQASLQSQMTAAGASGKPSININYFGPQMPSPEQSQAMMSQLSAMVGVS